jgi:hypothetical protein
MSNKYCTRTGKVKLSGGAYLAKVLQDMERRNGHAMRGYLCPACNKYHITSDGESRKANYKYVRAR